MRRRLPPPRPTPLPQPGLRLRTWRVAALEAAAPRHAAARSIIVLGGFLQATVVGNVALLVQNFDYTAAQYRQKADIMNQARRAGRAPGPPPRAAAPRAVAPPFPLPKARSLAWLQT